MSYARETRGDRSSFPRARSPLWPPWRRSPRSGGGILCLSFVFLCHSFVVSLVHSIISEDRPGRWALERSLR